MSARGWAAFAAMSLIWGVPYLFIKVAVDDGVSPAFLSFARVALAAALLLALAWRAGVLGQLRGRWRWIAAYAVIEIALPFPLIAAGEQYVSSSLTAILIACVPLIVALLAIRFDAAERATGVRLRRPADRVRRRGRAGRHRRRGQRRRAARHGADPARRRAATRSGR